MATSSWVFHPKQSVLVVAWSGHASSEVALCIENETPNHCLLGLSTIQGNHSTLWSVCFYSGLIIVMTLACMQQLTVTVTVEYTSYTNQEHVL